MIMSTANASQNDRRPGPYSTSTYSFGAYLRRIPSLQWSS